ncbi:MAG: translation elongation factor Ts [Anaerolineae bacterium]
MEITAKMVKELREMTGVGPLDCKKALEEFDGDMEKAANFLREKGLAKAAKKAGRATNEGVIEIYLHHNRRVGVMLELNCETDFVAKTEKFQDLAHNLALHIANLAPQYVKREDVPAALVEEEMNIQRARAREEGKPEHIIDKIVEGRMDKFYQDLVLLDQEYLLGEGITVAQLIQEAIADLGENIQIARFARFAIGEGQAEDEE